MSLEEVPAILDVIRTIKNNGNKTILLIEHKMDMILDLSDSIMVLFNGQTTCGRNTRRNYGK